MGEEPLRHAASARSSVACIVTDQGGYPTAKRQTARRARKMVADAAGRAGRPAGAGLDSNNKGRAVLFMALLALQIGVQPVIVKTCIDKLQVALVSVVVGQELMKLVIAFFMLQIECRGQLRAVLDGSSMRESVKLGALPSVIYAVQNLLCQVGYQHLDFLSFNLLNQTKLLSTAVFVFLLTGKRQSLAQCGALGMLFLGAILLMMEPNSSKAGSGPGVGGDNFVKGVLPVLVASLLSGLAGGLTQVALQGSRRNSFLYSCEIAFFSLCVLPIIVLATPDSLGGAEDRSRMLNEGLFAGWTRMTVLPVFTSAIGGIFVGQVTKYAGGVEKSFSVIAGILITSVMQSVLSQEDISPWTRLAAPLVRNLKSLSV